MAKKKQAAPSRAPVDLGRAVREAYATNERINQLLLEHLDESLWHAPPPNAKPNSARTIAAVVAHMHNVRLMWLKVVSKRKDLPPKLDRKKVALPEARAALAASAQALDGLLASALENGGRVRDFRPDVVGFLSYAIAHEAHHRGQICMLARMLGSTLPQEVNFGMWDWNKRWQEAVGAKAKEQ